MERLKELAEGMTWEQIREYVEQMQEDVIIEIIFQEEKEDV